MRTDLCVPGATPRFLLVFLLAFALGGVLLECVKLAAVVTMGMRVLFLCSHLLVTHYHL